MQQCTPKKDSLKGVPFKVYDNVAAPAEVTKTMEAQQHRTISPVSDGLKTGREQRPKEEYLTALLKGNYFLKFGRRGKPHKTQVILSEDLASLSWTPKKWKSQDRRRVLPFSSIVSIEAGQGTPVFKRFPQFNHVRKESFSVIFKEGNAERSLDLVCSTPKEFELWFWGLSAVQRGVLTQQTKTKRTSFAETDSTGKAIDKQDSAKDSKKAATSKPTPALRDLIGDVYIWGKPSGGVRTGQSSLGTAADGLQEAWVPALVNDTFRLDVATVSCGPRHAALITKNGETYTWGCGDAGRLGHGDCQSMGCPKMVLDLSGRGVIQLACGDWHTAAVTRDGGLYTWGDGTAGILGHGTPQRQWSPKRVERPLQGVCFTQVTAGPYHTAAVARNGNLYTWGDGFGGKLGHGGQDTCLSPRRVEALVDYKVISVAAGVWHTACVTLIPENPVAGTPTGSPAPASSRMSGFEPESPGDIISSSKGETSVTSPKPSSRSRKHRSERGVVWSWGGGDKGCLGNGDEEGRLLPQRMAGGPESVRQVCAGLHFTLMLSAGGKVWQCGATCSSGYDGKTIPAWEGSQVPARVKGKLGGLITAQMAAGMHHVAVIAGPAADPLKHLFTWGRGTEGQLGHGSALPGNSPNCPEPCVVKHLEGRRLLQVACGGCNTMAVVEHDPKASKDYDTVVKELQELAAGPRRMTGPPPGLLVSGLGPNYSPSTEGSGGHAVSSNDGRRSRAGSVISAAQSIAPFSRMHRPESEHGGSNNTRRSWVGPGTMSGAPAAMPPSRTLGGTPDVFTCPITHEVMDDPVVAADGYTYERGAIVKWLRESAISPMTQLPLDHKSLTPSIALRSAIEEWRQWTRVSTITPGSRRYAQSVGGSSHGSMTSYLLPPNLGGAPYNAPAVISAQPWGAPDSVRSQASSMGDQQHSFGARL